MKIELCQTNIVWENKKENIIKAEKIFKSSKSELLLFPEMSFTGFSMNTDLTGEKNYYTIIKMKEICKKYNKSAGFGWVYKDDDGGENHYTFVDNEGSMISDYVKIHPFSYSGEDKYFIGGDRISVFSFMGFKISSFICYDLRFPEVFAAASKKADIITVAANWPASRAYHWKTLLRARAIENMCYIFAVNCVGNMGGQYYSGDSCIIRPDGSIVDELSDKEGFVRVDIENDVENYRKAFPVRNDRREELYLRLMTK